MLLSEDVFEGIAQLLGGSLAAGAAGQRRGPRVTLDTRLTILPCPDGPDRAGPPPLSVPVRDLSRGGLRFLHSERLPLDTPFVALLPRRRQLNQQPGTDKPLALLAVVAYWQPLAKDLFALGGEFRRVLSGIDLPALREQPTIILPGLVGSERPASQTVEALRRAAG
jgi:hypothetical protein